MKQKLILLAMIFSLVCGSTSILRSDSVNAQATVPSSCLDDPESKRCKDCTTGVLLDQAEGCDLVPSSDDAAEEAATEEEKPACTPGENGCCGGVKTSIIGGTLCGDNTSAGEGGTVYMLLINVLQILTAGIGIAAVGGIAYGALLYTTAENKPEQTKKAINIITNVVIGIVAYGLMYVFLNFLIPGGVFTK